MRCADRPPQQFRQPRDDPARLGVGERRLGIAQACHHPFEDQILRYALVMVHRLALLDQQLRVGQLPFIQARILARHLRGDITDYVPLVPK